MRNLNRTWNCPEVQYREQTATVEEAAKAQDTYHGRLIQVNNLLDEQARIIGGPLNFLYFNLIENLKALEIAALASGRGVRRRILEQASAAGAGCRPAILSGCSIGSVEGRGNPDRSANGSDGE